MCRLNYTDLLGLIIENDIQFVSSQLRMLELQRRQQSGYEVEDAQPDQIKAYFTGGRTHGRNH